MPQLEPKEIIQRGSFGGIYFDHRYMDYKKYPADWFEGLQPWQFRSQVYDASVNEFGVKAGMNQKQWEQKGWITPDCPRGWFEWYCNIYIGISSKYDDLQVRRWINFKRWLNHPRTPVISQSLLHWAYEPRR
jgi:hypothetical protein